MTTTPASRNAGAALFTALVCTFLQPAAAVDRAVASGPESTDRQTQHASVALQYAALPMRFERNAGQSDERVNFLARGNGYIVFLTPDESVMVLDKRGAAATQGRQAKQGIDTAVVRMRLEGANAQPRVEGLDPLPGVTNYFIGNDASKWHTDIVSFSKVRYSEIYSGIDVVYYGNQRNLEYDFIVSPGADPSKIRMTIAGTEHLSVNAAGDLVLAIPGGEMRQQAPVIYQEGVSGKSLVTGSYVVRGDEVGFEIGAYDASRALVIDPVLVYSTYLGGSGLDQANAMAVSTTGFAYVTGVTRSTNFPIEGTPATTFTGVQDIFVTKMSLAGGTLAYSTYIGSPGTDIANDIFVTGAGTAYVTGSTDSIGFPVITPTIASYQGMTDAFLLQLNSAGNAIVFSTYWGGTGFEEGTGVTVDPTDAPYITGNTSAPDFPTQTPFQAALSNGTGMDAFMTKFSVSPGSIVYSTYLGGFGNDQANDIAVRDNGSVLVTGSTTSSNFPTTSASFQPALAGARDGFVTNFTLAGNALDYSSYLGGSGDDEAFGIVLDAPGNAYIAGRTNSTNFPTLAPAQLNNGGNNDAFATKVSASGDTLVYSTYLGGAGEDIGQGIAIDAARNTFVTGSTRSSNFPTVNPSQTNFGGVSDAFVTKLSPAGASIIYSTYLGGMGDDQSLGIGVDATGRAYVGGLTESTNFPTVNPFQSTFAGVRDAFVTKLSEAIIDDHLFADGFER